MTSISSYGQFLRMQFETQRIQAQQLELHTQAATGKKGTTLGDLGSQASHSVNVRAVLQHVQTYQSNIDSIELRASVMDTAMSRMSVIMDELRDEYTKLDGDLTTDTTFINEIGKRGLKELENLLNTQVEGRYVFAGNDLERAPVRNLDEFSARFASEISQYANPAVTGASVVTAMQAVLYDPAQCYAQTPPVAPDPAAFSTTLQYAGAPLKARVDVNRDVSYGLRADAPVFRDMLYALSTAANLTYEPGNQAAYDEVRKAGAAAGRSAITSLANETGRLGLVRSELKQLSNKHESIASAFEDEIGKVEDVDIADVATKLKLSDTALQSTFQIIASMRQFSLVNFLS